MTAGAEMAGAEMAGEVVEPRHPAVARESVVESARAVAVAQAAMVAPQQMVVAQVVSN